MIIIYPIGIPLLYAFLLFRERQELGTPTLSELARVRSNSRTAIQQAAADEESWDRMKHGHLLSFLLSGYKRKFYYFEVVECYRRLFLSGCLVMITSESIRVTSAVAICLAAIKVGRDGARGCQRPLTCSLLSLHPIPSHTRRLLDLRLRPAVHRRQ